MTEIAVFVPGGQTISDDPVLRVAHPLDPSVFDDHDGCWRERDGVQLAVFDLPVVKSGLASLRVPGFLSEELGVVGSF